MTALAAAVLVAVAALTAVLGFFFRKWIQGGQCTCRPDLRGRVAAVTGTTAGIGLHTALQLAKQGAAVVLLDRDQEKAKQVALRIKQEAPGAVVELIHCDLSDLDSVAAAAKKFMESHESLHILVNNAGVMMCPLGATKQGYEMQYGTNHLGHFLLTLKLLPALMNGARAGMSRVVMVASRAHKSAPAGGIDFDSLTHEQVLKNGRYHRVLFYAQSKLANILFTCELQRRYGKHGINAMCVHPGVVGTNLGRHVPLPPVVKAILIAMLNCVIKTPAFGAQTSLHCALAPLAQLVPGEYYSDCAVSVSSALSKDEGLARRLWETSMDQVQKYFQ
jgi:retinol dehydrogenase-12